MTLALNPPRFVRVCAVAVAFALGGCEERVPSINLLGAFFPAWMLCILAGIALTILARQLFTATGLDPWIGPRVLIYPALAQRPDLLARVAEIRAREADVRKAKSDFYPRITVGGNVGQVIGRMAVQGVPRWSGVNEPTWGALIAIEVPLYDGGLRRDRVGVAESQRRAAEDEFDSARDQVVREVIKAYDGLKLTFRKREAAAALLLAADNSYSATVDSYRHGIATFVDVSNAQAGLTKARTADAQTRAEGFAATATLAFSTGDLGPPLGARTARARGRD